MNAAEAHAITKLHLTTQLLEPLLEHVFQKIQMAAERGQFSVQDPHLGYDLYAGRVLSPELLLALWKALTDLGFEIHDHRDPDPGHPCSRPWVEVHWQDIK